MKLNDARLAVGHLRIAIIVDNPRRDLRGLVLLACQFARHGARVYLVPMYQQGYDLPLLAPDLVVVNYARESNRGLLETYRDLGYRVAVLDTEGGVLSETGLDSPNNWASSIRSAGYATLVNDYCFWGEEVHRAFVAHSGLSAAALAVTGCPRYDICIEPWAALLDYSRRDFILVNTNFSAINPAFTRSANMERQIFRDQGWDAAYVDALFTELQAVFPRYLDAIAGIARALPERVIQVRPHPFESDRIYKERFAGLGNVVIDGEGDIFNTIHGADCIVHLNCGSAIDAVRMGKTPITMEFLNSDVLRRHAPLPSRISCPAASPEDLVTLAADQTQRAIRFDNTAARLVIESWYHMSDGKAAERVAKFLLSRLEGAPRNARSGIGASLRGGRPRASGKQILQGAISLLGGSRFAANLAMNVQKSRRGKWIELPTVTDLVARFAELGAMPDMAVRCARSPLGGQALASFLIDRS